MRYTCFAKHRENYDGNIEFTTKKLIHNKKIILQEELNLQEKN